MPSKLGRTESARSTNVAAESKLPAGAYAPAERALRYKNTLALAEQIKTVIPGGVDSPFRAFHEVGGEAVFFDKADGSKLTDVDGNTYIDYLGAWGPAILGHAPEAVVTAACAVMKNGAVFGAPHKLELALAERVSQALPSVESVRFVNSGTEAVMSAVRLARAFTGREKILMFAGGYHGHSDSVLASTGHQSSTGILKASQESTLLAEYNDLASVERLFQKDAASIAAILVEPVCGSMGVVTPEEDFLPGLKAIAERHGALLIFDEVITGFRVAYGGAQNLFGIKPDLTCLGKALGGGMPIGAYGGSRQIMSQLMPEGAVYQAGTFSGNPVTMAGGVATLDLLKDESHYLRMEARASELFAGLSKLKTEGGYPIELQRQGSMFGIIFAAGPVRNFSQSKTIDAPAFARFFHYLLDKGVYLPPSPFDAAVLSSAHSREDIEITLAQMEPALDFAFNG
ncbi:MAG: glutamate-1-semialdehyde 2,1-aminomutase [Candidatus Obscuribacter sp.]|nr:glutamate-1-semialdehyde 2,1-aminomutase [Candidatus Obscuribacter sp.]